MIWRAMVLSLAALGTAGSAFAACEEPGLVDIYPTANVLPENLLRIYVYFPRAMDLGVGSDVVRLIDASGDPVAGVFLSNREDLWSPDRRRLTLLLDPGRVKTGLNAHEELGRALVPGREYAFEISAAALGADGCPLGAEMRHAFTVGPVDLSPPDPDLWGLTPPRAGSTEPLVVALGSTYDHLSLAYRLQVLGGDGAVVPGRVSLGEAEQAWVFTPRAPWKAETYMLAIDESLEDLAGNRPGLLFDRPLNEAPGPWPNRLVFNPAQ